MTRSRKCVTAVKVRVPVQQMGSSPHLKFTIADLGCSGIGQPSQPVVQQPSLDVCLYANACYVVS